jgi:transposase
MNLLEKHRADIELLLKHPNMTNTQIKRILEELETSVSVSSIDRFISKSFPKLSKHTVRLKTESGKEGQVDFGYVGMMKDLGGSLRKTYVFVMILSHSRYRYVEFVNSQDQLTWVQLHINAFKFFSGVPSRIILDNLKAGVIKSDIYDPILNETYSELSRFYGFIIDPARAYKPEHKGKVERSIRIVKEQLIAGREYKDIGAANIKALKWCQDEISHRI